MILLFQILNKNKNSKKILKVKKCENIDLPPFSILPGYSRIEVSSNSYTDIHSSNFRR
tara:strand:- start:2129 stop:2302 length:174 start_codon:yes stop_codon:yes gene_type:complete